MDPLFFGILFVGGGAVVLFKLWHAEAVEKAWQQAADKLGLERASKGWFGKEKMAGSYQGIPLEVWLRKERRSSGKNTRTYYYTVVESSLRIPAFLGVTIARRSLGKKLLGFIGLNTAAPIGDARIDDRFDCTGNVSEELKMLLKSREAQEILLGISESFDRFTITEGRLIVESEGSPRDANRIIRMVERATHRIQALEELTGLRERYVQAPVAPQEQSWSVPADPVVAGEAIW